MPTSMTFFPVIDLAATGSNIRRLRVERGLTVRELQNYFGFEEPRAIYKWQKGESLPTVDNLFALSKILCVPMETILVPVGRMENRTNQEQQDVSCCSRVRGGRFEVFFFCLLLFARLRGRDGSGLTPFSKQLGDCSKRFCAFSKSSLEEQGVCFE